MTPEQLAEMKAVAEAATQLFERRKTEPSALMRQNHPQALKVAIAAAAKIDRGIAELLEPQWPTILALIAHVEALREALRPFAAFADPTDRCPARMTVTQGSQFATRQLTMGDCYCARDALGETK